MIVPLRSRGKTPASPVRIASTCGEPVTQRMMTSDTSATSPGVLAGYGAETDEVVHRLIAGMVEKGKRIAAPHQNVLRDSVSHQADTNNSHLHCDTSLIIRISGWTGRRCLPTIMLENHLVDGGVHASA
ncbi:hypothetical protein [Bradyrhizobium sp. BR 1432]|uniref:hypothetical protein n=1 Tax=Bradyrhizobium sp. BR 1432 TaxID=3447966 RepID=UPI003EE5950F